MDRIKENPRYFYSFARENRKLICNDGPLLNKAGDLTDDPETMANILQGQYSSVFSNPLSPKKSLPKFSVQLESLLENIEFTEKDIIEAINEISLSVKKLQSELAHPILLLWKHSMVFGCVPRIYKNQIITHVYKKSNKANAANYRPISLTTHVIKIFERLVKIAIVSHLDKNHII